ncbi:PTS system mannose/fructose/N-acetylgalactosamine-transporter subunit IIB [Paramicrobacterium agarici]|uniref:PTS system mannose-specific IIB component n=1 Tax=Paramicrobacterium agarici TaxID=630514 RepID=A0A2A9DXP2_9MICO|nr:PTS sugar transporter subunit IIB [Microbacterium agarici]PFG30700.1 PTS system mannose-specific IIB component [Microbacterium agarici]
MRISLIRVDDRLIHGQVVMGWTQALGIEQILVADDEIAVDETQKQLLLMAVPAGVTADVLTIADSATIVNASDSAVSTMVLVRGPAELAALRSAGMPMSTVNVGNVHTAPERKRLTKEVHASDEEIGIWRDLAAAGVRLEARWLPSSPVTDLGRLVGTQS